MPFLAKEHYPIPTKDILSWTFDDLGYDWDEPVYVDGLHPQNFISARQARMLIRRLVAGLRAIGVQKGDCVCISSFNDVHYPIFFLGLVAIGGVFAGVNPSYYTPYELVHALKTANAKYILVQPALLDGILKASKEAGLSQEKIIIFNPNGEPAPAGFRQWKDLLQHGESDWIRFDDLSTSQTTTAARLFSSGTTGLPKAAELSHYNFVAQHTLVFDANPRPWRSKCLLCLPMFHVATAPNAFCSFLRAGHQGVVLPRFDLEKALWAFERYGITDIVVVPPVVIMIINSPLSKKYNLQSIRSVRVGAAPLDKHPQARFQALLSKDASFTQVWGMTETTCIATRFPYPETDTTGGVGRPLPNIDMKLVDDDGKDVSDYGARGEVCVRGPTVIRGYFDNSEASKRGWDEDGYFHTGDIGYVDMKTGSWYIVDRKKELIKVRGFQVAPPELEGVLLSHPDIVDAAVIGVPDPSNPGGSESPRAYLVRRPGRVDKLSAEDVHRHMKERLAGFKMLHGGIVFVDAVPKNASGKILKRILRDQAKKEMGAKL